MMALYQPLHDLIFLLMPGKEVYVDLRLVLAFTLILLGLAGMIRQERQ